LNYEPPYKPLKDSYLTPEEVLAAPGWKVQEHIEKEFGPP